MHQFTASQKHYFQQVLADSELYFKTDSHSMLMLGWHSDSMDFRQLVGWLSCHFELSVPVPAKEERL